MMSKLCTTLILLVGLVAISVQGSAIKGHHQAQPVQRVEEQARVSSVKSPASQLAERSPKSAPVQSAAPILESSKKVYNDISYRRSVSQPQASGPAQAPAAAAAVEQVASVVTQQKASQESAVPAAAPVAKGAAEAPVVEVAKPNDELPAQSVRSVVAKAQPEPAEKAAAAPVVESKPVVAEAPQAQQAPADLASDVVESKPVVAEAPQAQQAPAKLEARRSCKENDDDCAAGFKAVKSEPVEKAAAPVVVESKPVVAEAPQAQQAPADLDARKNCSPWADATCNAVESKPVVPDAQQQPAAAAAFVVTKVQPEPVEKAAAASSVESSLQAKKDEPSAKEAAHEPIEVPAPDPGLVLSEPIDSTTKLLIDLDEHVQKFLPAEDKQEPAQPPKEAVLVNGVDYSPPQAQSSDSQPSGKSSVPLMPYSSNADNEPIVPPLPASLDKVDKAAAAVAPAQVPSAGQSATRQANHNQHQNQQQVITQLLDQLDSLQNRIQDTINQLVARRRYVMSALLRPMGTYVRRVRTNLERLQNRVNQLQAAASSVGGNSQNQRPGGFVDAAAIETIRRRIDDISKRISDIVNRIRFSLTPTSAPLNNNGRK